MIADTIVGRLADAYGELFEEKKEIQAELDALKAKITNFGGSVTGEKWGVRMTLVESVRYPGLVAWMKCHRPLQLRDFAEYSHCQRAMVRDLTKKVKK